MSKNTYVCLDEYSTHNSALYYLHDDLQNPATIEQKNTLTVVNQ